MADTRRNPAARAKQSGTARAKQPDPAPEPAPEVEGAEGVEETNGATGKAPALYHVYSTEDDGKTLSWITDVTAKTAEHAVSMVVGQDDSLVGQTLVVTPQRNLKTFSTEVKTTTRVKVSAA